MNSLVFPVSLHFIQKFVLEEIQGGEIHTDLFYGSLYSLKLSPGSFLL